MRGIRTRSKEPSNSDSLRIHTSTLPEEASVGKPGAHFSLHSVANSAVTITGVLGGGFQADCNVTVWAHDDVTDKEIAGNADGWTRVGEGVLKGAATSSLCLKKPLVILPEGVVSIFVQATQGCICLTSDKSKNGTFELLPNGYQTAGIAFNAADFLDDVKYSIAGGVEYRGSTEEERCAALEAEDLDAEEREKAGLGEKPRRRSYAVEVVDDPLSPTTGYASKGLALYDPSPKEILAIKLKTIFREFDSEQESVISCDRLRTVLKECDPSFTKEELDALANLADKNKTGFIEYDEFIDFVCFLRDSP